MAEVVDVLASAGKVGELRDLISNSSTEQQQVQLIGFASYQA
jgi:uncharacterized transporter YbjL